MGTAAGKGLADTTDSGRAMGGREAASAVKVAAKRHSSAGRQGLDVKRYLMMMIEERRTDRQWLTCLRYLTD